MKIVKIGLTLSCLVLQTSLAHGEINLSSVSFQSSNTSDWELANQLYDALDVEAEVIDVSELGSLAGSHFKKQLSYITCEKFVPSFGEGHANVDCQIDVRNNTWLASTLAGLQVGSGQQIIEGKTYRLEYFELFLGSGAKPIVDKIKYQDFENIECGTYEAGLPIPEGGSETGYSCKFIIKKSRVIVINP